MPLSRCSGQLVEVLKQVQDEANLSSPSRKRESRVGKPCLSILDPRVREGEGCCAVKSVQLRANLLAQDVDRHALRARAEMPERPAVAGGRALYGGADLVDRAAVVGGDDGAVGADPGRDMFARVGQHVAGLEQAAFDQRAERDARLGAFLRGGQQRDVAVRLMSFSRSVAIVT